MKKLLVFLLLVCTITSFAQKDSLQLGDRYADDQLYFMVTYSQLNNQPDFVNGSGFSYSLSAGFLKDFILNKRGNLSFALGTGYGFDSFNHGFKITEIAGKTEVDVDITNLTSNDYFSHSIEFPFEIRWRTSNANKYKFWRIYAGVKASYNFSNRFYYNDNTVSFKNLSRFNKWQYGLTLSTGYDTFNFHMYYGLSPILKDAPTGLSTITTQILKFGFIFYIL